MSYIQACTLKAESTSDAGYLVLSLKQLTKKASPGEDSKRTIA
jgi:hypothetical protein